MASKLRFHGQRDHAYTEVRYRVMNAVDLLYISLLHNINTAMLYNDMDDDEQEAWVQQQLDD